MQHMTSRHAKQLREQCLENLAEAQGAGRGDNARAYMKQLQSLDCTIARAEKREAQQRLEAN